MKLSFIGAGYVGLINGICLSNLGHHILFIDNNIDLIMKLKNQILPIHEPNLYSVFRKNLQLHRLVFSSNLKLCVFFSEIIFITLPTTNYINNILHIIHCIVQYNINKNPKIIVNKSTVPVGTVIKVKNYLKKKNIDYIDVISNPEFLREGKAVYDFMNPVRLIIGSNNYFSIIKLKELYNYFINNRIPFIITHPSNAEFIKYVCNAFLATRISFINEIANICDNININVNDILYAIGLDKRIGNKYLVPGFGFGGGCLIKDLKYLIDLGVKYSNKVKLLRSVMYINTQQRYIFYKKIINYFNYNLYKKKIVIWGVSFKENTDDIRNAPSIYLINKLLKFKCKIYVFDPISLFKIKLKFKYKIRYSHDMYNILYNADALIIATNNKIFRNINYHNLINKMKNRVIFDAKNVLDTKFIKKYKFYYESIGNVIKN